MVTQKTAKSSRGTRCANGPKQSSFLQDGRKLNVKLQPEELVLACNLARILARPGQVLTTQDVLRIALANLGIANFKLLAIDTDKSS